MALLDGNVVFGLAVKCGPPAFNERRLQKASYPALNGMESLDMGDQGAYSTVTGLICGNNPSNYRGAVALLYSYVDGNAHVLTDNDGFSWPNVLVVGIEPSGRGYTDPVLGYCREFSVRLLHLTLS